MNEILNSFGINPILLAAQVVNFLILLLILKKFLYGPILKVLDQRKQKIEQSLKNADEIEKRLLETNEKSEKILAETLQESQKIMDQTKLAANEMLEETKQTAQEILNKAYEQVQEVNKAEKLKMQQEMKESMAGLVALAFEKITGQKTVSREQRSMIEKEVKNLS